MAPQTQIGPSQSGRRTVVRFIQPNSLQLLARLRPTCIPLLISGYPALSKKGCVAAAKVCLDAGKLLLEVVCPRVEGDC